MKYSGIGLIIFGILIIAFPAIIAYLLGTLFIALGISTFLFVNKFHSFTKKNEEPFVKFGNYKIYR